MRSRLALCVSLSLLALLSAGCPSTTPERPHPAPTADALLAYLETQSERAGALRAESTMDYWVGGERVRGTVLLMAEQGAKARLNALTPAGDTVAADLACDGSSFTLVDYNEDCQRTGPCDARSIGQLLGVWLEPDELLLLATGNTPRIAFAEASLSWNAERAAEELALVAEDGRRQRIFLQKSGEHWDVVASELEDPDGDIAWELENRDFHTLEGEQGAEFRVPERSRFQQPAAEADLAVRWEEREANPEIDPSAFQMSVPAGLPSC